MGLKCKKALSIYMFNFTIFVLIAPSLWDRGRHDWFFHSNMGNLNVIFTSCAERAAPLGPPARCR